jgi:hypothetical protein
MTTVQEIEKLLNDYRAWLKDKTTLREVNDSWVEITTPYIDRHMIAIPFTTWKRPAATSTPKSAKTSYK